MFILPAALALSSIFSPFHASSFHAFVGHSTPVSQTDARVSFVIHNDSQLFHDVEIDGRNYTIPAHDGITVKALTGTVVLAGSRFGKYHPGDVLLTVTPALSDSKVDLQ